MEQNCLLVDLGKLRSNIDNLDIDKLKNVPSGLGSLKSKVDKLDIWKLETSPVGSSKLGNVAKTMSLKRLKIKTNILKIKYLILQS